MDYLNQLGFNPLLVITILVFVVYYWINQSAPSTLQQNQQQNQPPFHSNINQDTVQNHNYRHVIYTTENFQLVLMTLQPNQDIGMETHPKTTQFIRVEEGQGLAIINQQEYPLEDDTAIVIPPNATHNIINTNPTKPLKLYSIYTPPEHPPNTLQPTKPTDDHH